MLHEREYCCQLLDHYDVLLTGHQKDILHEYFYEDLSMGEIAENYGVSKSAIQDLIKRTIRQLNGYEEKMKLIEKDEKMGRLLEEMKKEDNALLNSYIRKINKIR